MTITRRNLLRHLGFGSVAVIALAPRDAFAMRSQTIPDGPVTQRLAAPPPNKWREDQLKRKRAKSKHKSNPHYRARTQRALGTLDTPGNRRDLALTMWGEARGYGTQGMRAIGHVIMNRVKEDKKWFGRGINGVCHKRKQFSCWNKGDPNFERMEDLPKMDEHNPDWVAFVKADRLAGRILSGIDPDNTGGAIFYHAEGMIPYWRKDMIPVGVMFGHIFYKEKPTARKRQAHHTHDSHHRHKPVVRYNHSHSSHHSK